MALFREQADVSVRPATPQDEAPIARVQLRAWRATHGELLGEEVLEHLDVTAIQAQWARAITAPPSPAHRVLVACAGPRVVGFAACAPVATSDPVAASGHETGSEEAADDDAGVEVLALEVDPDHLRGGHGSRLLTACVDLARESGARHVRTWVLDGDAARTQFLGSAGLGPDGATRDLGVGATADGGTRTITEHRWVATL